MFQTTESADRIRELLDRNLQDVFGEADPGRRIAAVEALWAEDGILHVPPGVVTGRNAIASFAGELRATHPDFVYAPRGKPQVLQNAGRLAWGSGPAAEEAVYTGWDVIMARNGQIVASMSFSTKRQRSSGGARPAPTGDSPAAGGGQMAGTLVRAA